ncbi:hypothetical protein [Arthrobacter globiformis]|uniref:hypothetical protein n=1 Tax=Arthrobacter globiformis TaxID=1665 RepID=UPI0027851149|nr:hypothetical protein [Arthrobacter globiformis]MDQ0864550.1 hypothetical protein [Arthrobacter globiformis]
MLVAVDFPLLGGNVDENGTPAFGLVSTILFGSVAVVPLIGLIRMFTVKRNNPTAYSGVIDSVGATEPSEA